VQFEAIMSVLTTVLVIIIILSGIALLTKDLTFLSRNLLKPLRELADDMESIAQLQLAGVAEPEEAVMEQGTSEVRLIRRTFENMKKAIKSWGKYVPWPVVQLLLRANVEANLEVNEVEVTIYFSDIQSFTTIVESMNPESSLLLLSRYFNDMSKVIDDHGGVVLEFIGDAILCIYGAPLINADHASAGAKAALRMLGSLRRMNEWSAQRELPEVKIRCGVHTGKVLVGNMGFHSRMKYGIVGEDSHMPSTLEEINKTYGTNMMISQTTWEKIDTDSVFITRPADYVQLRKARGSSGEIIYQVIERERKTYRASRYWNPFELHGEAFKLYRERSFEEAHKRFIRVGRMMEDITGSEDEASKLMVKRCESYMQQPPPEDWDGVWDRGNS
jgi:adenylate cyclase